MRSLGYHLETLLPCGAGESCAKDPGDVSIRSSIVVAFLMSSAAASEATEAIVTSAAAAPTK